MKQWSSKIKNCSIKKVLFSFPARLLTGIALTMLGFYHPAFFVIGGFTLLLYALPLVITACCFVVAFETFRG